eukprot:TRINITY_DN9190_c0_g2_i1.p1 TRINITY_DN9190_c0_g2~~TRINITY_DN9190_c0_g2_i1.p1  ORF type:complete len:111 (+),score=2.17 TRINITY_DN9190_c0_g2_i1:268-600(+)
MRLHLSPTGDLAPATSHMGSSHRLGLRVRVTTLGSTDGREVAVRAGEEHVMFGAVGSKFLVTTGSSRQVQVRVLLRDCHLPTAARTVSGLSATLSAAAARSDQTTLSDHH